MGKYSVPESIRLLKPKGTMVKNISGHYYVYEYSNFTDENGKRHTKMGAPRCFVWVIPVHVTAESCRATA